MKEKQTNPAVCGRSTVGHPKTAKRILALLLTCCMLATALCLPAFAVDATENSEPVAEQTGEGVEAVADDVIEISDEAGFRAIKNNLAGNYKLVADIEFEEIVHLGAFNGTLDGDGHTLTIQGEYSASSSYGMLFNTLLGATIKNIQIGTEEEPVRFSVGAISSGTNIGLLGHNVSGGTVISNVDVYIDADLSGATKSTLIFGAFFPRSTADTTTITNCTANGKINVGTGGGTKSVAGFFGSLSGTAKSKTTASATLTNCVNNVNVSGNMTGTLNAAGFVGTLGQYGELDIKNCVNNGDISDTNAAGSVGSMIGTKSGTATMTGCVNLGTLNGETVSEDGIANNLDGITSKITQTNAGAGVRIVLDDKGTGLRFKFTMDDASIASLDLLSRVYGEDNVQVGAIFLPTKLVGEKALTAENYANALTMAGSASEITDGYYHASLVKLYDTHYDIEYSCQSFWRFRTSADGEWITVYANNTKSRAVAGVAAEALADPNKPNYSQEQLNILNAYAKAQNG